MVMYFGDDDIEIDGNLRDIFEILKSGLED